MLLVAEEHMIKQGAITWQEGASHFEGLRVPVLRLLGLGVGVKARDRVDLLLDGDDESYLS